MVDILQKFYELTHLRGPNDKRPIDFHVNIPVMVYVAIDPRNHRNTILPSDFKATGEKIIHGGLSCPHRLPDIRAGVSCRGIRYYPPYRLQNVNGVCETFVRQHILKSKSVTSTILPLKRLNDRQSYRFFSFHLYLYK